MKKTTIMAALAATVMAAGVFSAEVPHLGPYSYKDITEAQALEVLTLMVAQPDAASCWAVANASVTNNFSSILSRRDMAAFRRAADEALAATGYCDCWWYMVTTMPKCSESARQAIGADVAYPQTAAIAKRLGADIALYRIAELGTLDDFMLALSEAVAFPARCSFLSASFAVAKKRAQKTALRAVKRYIRSQGRSFVTKNGVNPCEEYITGLTEALNAPRFAGLDAWLKSIGHKGVDLSKMPSEEEVAKLKEDILFGDRDMDDRAKAILEVCLGVEGYNAFVREYNGE